MLSAETERETVASEPRCQVAYHRVELFEQSRFFAIPRLNGVHLETSWQVLAKLGIVQFNLG